MNRRDDAGASQPDGSAAAPGADSGAAGSGGVDSVVDAGAGSAAAPVVEILSPSAASDPNGDEVVTTSMVSVRCAVRKADHPEAREVDQQSVTIERVDLDEPTDSIAGTVAAVGAEEFEATFFVDEIPNGPLRFRCSAGDTGSPSLQGTAELDTLLDLGPSLRILAPEDGSNHALKLPVLMKIEVLPAPIAEGDLEAEPKDLQFRVLGQLFELTEDPSQAGIYTTSIDFDDRSRFPMPPTDVDIEISAASSRSPSAPRRSVTHMFKLDAEGPTIVVKSPKDSTIVRGQVELVLEISDPSGVASDTVVANVNNETVLLTKWDQVGTTYRARFDTRIDAFQDRTQLSINITAMDLVANESTISHLLLLDNVAPILSLDPPLIREYYMLDESTRVCSGAFDPVGPDATNDLDVVPGPSLHRVFAVERTNVLPGENVAHHAGMNEDSVELYVQVPDFDLLIDTDGDGVCDEINFEDLGLIDRPGLQRLEAVVPAGSASYLEGTAFSEDGHTASASLMCTSGMATTLPPYVCSGASSMRRVLPQPYGEAGQSFAAVFAFSLGTPGGIACTGKTWDLLNHVPEGWACLAARGEDAIGNVGVSPPLRVCIDDGIDQQGTGVKPCDPLTDPIPKCAECTSPDKFEEHRTWRRR
ncbi:MAG: hypothetical protein OEZ06_16010 [Myxococcales bacterium]|nr:hypothetical protein [Myxococcales bacterium]